MFVPLRLSNPKSQKARGVRVLALRGCVSGGLVLWNGEDLSGSELFRPPMFARPCPLVPRHGFVESRVVHTLEDLLRVRADIVEQAPEEIVEVLLMEPIKAIWSAILTPSGLTIGPGNDGATGGRGVSIPFEWDRQGVERWIGGTETTKSAGVPDEEDPYVELVADKSSVWPVQIRAGSRIPTGRVICKGELVVGNVVHLEEQPEYVAGNLLAWEARVKGLAHDTVVWIESGNIASHFGVHCLARGVPVVLGAPRPKEGETLKPEVEPRGQRDYAEIARGVAAKVNVKLDPYSMIIGFAMLHGYGKTGKTPAAHALIGRGASYTFRAAVACCLGETRHKSGKAPGWNVPFWKDQNGHMAERDYVYEQSFGLDFARLLGYSRVAEKVFSLKWKPGYGGPKWKSCAIATTHFGRTLVRFVEEPAEATWGKALAAWNSLVNQVHNGGSMLNKVLSSSTMNEASKRPFDVLTRSLAMRRIVEDDLIRELIEGGQLEPYTMRPETRALIRNVELGTLKACMVKKVPKKKSGTFDAQIRMLHGAWDQTLRLQIRSEKNKGQHLEIDTLVDWVEGTPTGQTMKSLANTSAEYVRGYVIWPEKDTVSFRGSVSGRGKIIAPAKHFLEWMGENA